MQLQNEHVVQSTYNKRKLATFQYKKEPPEDCFEFYRFNILRLMPKQLG